ncbi:MAG: hypothetical protein U0R24_08145 [Solirubrobacterales bacterium]
MRRSSRLAATGADVWARAVTFDGVNDEFAPLLRMTRPSGLPATATIADIEPGEPVGRSWLLLGGVLPVDWDDLRIVEVEPPHRFLERSSMASMRSWQHERRIEPSGEGECLLTDSLEFELRRPLRWIPGAGRLAERIVGWVFDHRHARLRLAHGAGTPNVRQGSP